MSYANEGNWISKDSSNVAPAGTGPTPGSSSGTPLIATDSGSGKAHAHAHSSSMDSTSVRAPGAGASVPPASTSSSGRPSLSLDSEARNGLGFGGPNAPPLPTSARPDGLEDSTSPSLTGLQSRPGMSATMSSLNGSMSGPNTPSIGTGATNTGATFSSSSASASTNPTSISNNTTAAAAPPLTPHTPASAGPEEIVPLAFDEAMLRALCDVDCGMPLLYDRIKQSMVSTREASAFFKKRAAIEEEYARSLQKLASTTAQAYTASDGKAGTYVNAWHTVLKTHEQLGDSRLRFANQLSNISDELATLAKEVDKSRKTARETGLRLERSLQEAETGVDKARARFDSTAEELERLLLVKSGESAKIGELHNSSSASDRVGVGAGGVGKRTLGKAIGKSGLLFNKKNPQQILRQEEDIRVRTSNASDTFRKEVTNAQQIRQEYFNLQLPRILRTLKENAEEIDNGLQYHLARYAFLFESTILADGMAISPVTDASNPNAPQRGLKHAIETIDNRNDFKQFMQNYIVVHGNAYRGPRREGPAEEGFVQASGSSSSSALLTGAAARYGANAAGGGGGGPRSPAAASRPLFGVDLAMQMVRDGVEVPPVLEKCAAAIEAVGLQSMGIYRLSGTTSKVQRLKGKFDQDWTAVDLMNDEAISDINIIAGCLKLWFRELPEPLLTHDLYAGFIDAAKVENERLRQIRLHERVNELPDANYATLKYLMGHLDRIREEESVNQMSASNLAIVFGPTLLSPREGSAPALAAAAAANGAAGGSVDPLGQPSGLQLQDMGFQCRAVETILEKYREIFVDESEE
ncbi:Rho GTPase-activating protein [Tilletia horrida]|uniref:Rho GTPase-activating protein n=1 Tax=Tilletia horrida TaxID=155126 RepID=A0AAN6JT06_9BASI|nr:Rho GTPase-activating protein [Tilletia horrida]KAK0567637.1 Rho GTPase-activating protein [Tilletia horrida]